ISSLGDPFNVPRFWNELARCLRPKGQCIFTSPSYEWATSFRTSSSHERPGCAFFELSNGCSIYVPSFVYSIDSQRNIIEQAGLQIVDTATIDINLVGPPYSPKLLSNHGIVAGFTAVKK